MKKLLLAVIIAALTIPGFSQEDMPVAWQKDMGIKYIYTGTGLASLILPYNDQIVVVGEKGLSTFNPADGKFIRNSVYKKSIPAGRIKNIILMKTDKDDFAAFNLDDLSYKQYNARKGAKTWLEREDARYVYVYEKKGVTKLQVY